MANVASLYLESAGMRTELRFAKYRLPVLWLACFAPTDVTATPDEDGELEVSLSTTPAEAIALLAARGDALAALITNVDDFLPQWLAFLRALGEGRLVVDATEVLSMNEEDDLVEPLRSALGMFEEPPKASVLALVDLASLGDHLDPATRVVTTPAPKRLREVVPEHADLYGPDELMPEDPAAEAMMGVAIADPYEEPTGQTMAERAGGRPSPATQGEWSLNRSYAIVSALLCAFFVFQILNRGTGPSLFGAGLVAWSAASAVSLWFRPRLGSWVFGVGPVVWLGALAGRFAAGHRVSPFEIAGLVVAASAWFLLRRELAAGGEARPSD